MTTALAIAVAGVIAPAGAADPAKSYPTRPVRLIVPNGPGSAVDTLTRIVANQLTQELGQQLVIDNRGGAAGIIGMEIAKNAKLVRSLRLSAN
ncbi:MAG: tripartite tricarboxylate transporter substrate-binding protein [Betaproteobacteria bacterium]|nr:tripartite tricarboxylate transporter substrate-binding protein [Betaproteobacteria bacterium]MDH3437113.1 tripartite tricarboxylate transporter substrate-binding protein [Betaproteobacteria bacterium]